MRGPVGHRPGDDQARQRALPARRAAGQGDAQHARQIAQGEPSPVMTQIRRVKIGLQAYINAIDRADTDACLSSRWPQTVPHILLECRKGPSGWGSWSSSGRCRSP